MAWEDEVLVVAGSDFIRDKERETEKDPSKSKILLMQDAIVRIKFQNWTQDWDRMKLRLIDANSN